MPKFAVNVDGKTYLVEIPDPAACPLQVIVDGQAFTVDVGPLAPPITTVPAGATATPMPPGPSRPTPSPRPPAAAAAAGEAGAYAVYAPMPGTILTIEVAESQEVAAGQVLCTLEAMKMKNPIRATRPGHVVDVVAREGQTVAHGDLLLRIA